MEVTGVDGAPRPLREGVVIDGDAAPFAASHILVVVEAERAEMADAAELSSLKPAADALAGVLNDDQDCVAARSP